MLPVSSLLLAWRRQPINSTKPLEYKNLSELRILLVKADTYAHTKKNKNAVRHARQKIRTTMSLVEIRVRNVTNLVLMKCGDLKNAETSCYEDIDTSDIAEERDDQ